MNISETSDGIFATLTDEDIRNAAARLASNAMSAKQDEALGHLAHVMSGCMECSEERFGYMERIAKLKAKNKRLKKRLREATGSP